MENTGGAATPSGVPADEDRVSAMGASDREVVYHINRRMVTKEEWTQLHQNWEDQRRQRQEGAEENMNNGREPKDHEEVVGDNHHNDDDPLHEGTVATLQFPIR